MRKNETNKYGVNYDKMKYTCLEWKGFAFWAIKDPININAFSEFEVYSTRKYMTYKMSKSKKHPSGWQLDIIKFGETKPTARVSEHELLKNANFEELFAVMAVLVDEEENPNIFEFITKNELIRLMRKWKRWAKDFPDWIEGTIIQTKIRLNIPKLIGESEEEDD